jgi:hypothetical protein
MRTGATHDCPQRLQATQGTTSLHTNKTDSMAPPKRWAAPARARRREGAHPEPEGALCKRQRLPLDVAEGRHARHKL